MKNASVPNANLNGGRDNMVIKYPKRKYRVGVSYVTVGIKEPRIKNNAHFTPELRAAIGERTKKLWQIPGKLQQRTDTQIQRKHPWRQNYPV